MAVSKQVDVRIPPKMLSAVDAFAKQHGMNRSNAIRELISRAIESPTSTIALNPNQMPWNQGQKS